MVARRTVREVLPRKVTSDQKHKGNEEQTRQKFRENSSESNKQAQSL
jgi:hypothetical protein